MKVYTYKHTELGLAGWPQGEFRLDGVEHVGDPNEADIFLTPGPLSLFENPASLDRFPYMAGREDRHVFGDVSEIPTIFNKKCMFIRCNLKAKYKAVDINSIAWAWPVENYAECIDVPADGFTYDVSFHGWIIPTQICSTRFDATQSCLDFNNDHPLKCDFARYDGFTGAIYATSEGLRRRFRFRQSMRESRLALCPHSIPGDFPYRFFEAMSAGRVPVLVGRDQVFPFADEIPYHEFILHIDVDDQCKTGAIVRKFLDTHSDDDLIRMGRLAREYWVRYLNRDDWPRTMRYAVEKVMHRNGLLDSEPVLCD